MSRKKMYLLRHMDGTEFVLVDDRSYTVGRRKCDITLESKDISRSHAKIVLRNTHVFVVHLQSSNQTAINGNLLSVGKEYELNVGCQVKFGVAESIFSLQEDVLMVSTSGMARENKLKVKSFVEKRGGIFNLSWSKDNTHLAIDNFVLTVNTCGALIAKQKIVKFQYFVDCWNCVERSEKLPDVNKYLPTPTVDMVNSKISFKFEMDRQWLFRNKTFVFPNAASAKGMKNLIGMASGKVIDIEQDRLSKDELLSSESEYLLMMMDANVDTEDNSYFGECVRHVLANDRRPIPVQEIPTAILYGSCDVQCNPKFNKIGHLVSGKQIKVAGKVLVPETQTQSLPLNVNKRKKIGSLGVNVDEQILVPETQTQSMEALAALPGLGVHKKRVPPEMELPIAKRPCSIPSSTDDSTNITDRIRNVQKDKCIDLVSPRASNKRKIPADGDAVITAKRTNVVINVLSNLTLKSPTAADDEDDNVQVIEDSDEESESSVMTIMTCKDIQISDLPKGTTIKPIIHKESPPAVPPVAERKQPLKETNSHVSLQISPWISKKKDIVKAELDANVSFKMIVCKELTFSRSQHASISLVNSSCTSTTMNSTSNGEAKNFKKFKKVQAHHPQTRIISHKNLKPVKCGVGEMDEKTSSSKRKDKDEEEVVARVPSSSKTKKQTAASKFDEDDDDDEIIVVPKKKKQSAASKFDDDVDAASPQKKKRKQQELRPEKKGFIFNVK